MPSLSQSTTRAVLWNVVLIPLLGVLSLVSSALVARTLSVDEYRVYGLAIATVTTLLLWSDLGISSAVARFTPDLRKLGRPAMRRFLGVAATTRFAALTLAVVGLVLVRVFWPSSEGLLPFHGVSLWLIVLTASAQGAARILQYFLSGLFQRGRVGAILLVTTGAQSLLVILAALFGTGVVGILAALAFAALLELGMSRFWASRGAAEWPADSGSAGEAAPHELWKDAVRYAGTSCADKVASYLNGPSFVVFVIAAMASPEVAYFVVASEFAVRFVSFLSVPLSGVTLPLFSTVDEREDPAPLAGVLRLYLMLLFLLFVPAAVFLTTTADVLLPFLYGERYADAVPILRWYVPFLFLEYTVYSALLAALMTRRKYREVLLSKLPLLAGVPAVFLVVPGWGARGAVIAFGAARLLAAALLLLLGRQALGFRFPGLYCTKVVAASAGAALAMALARPLLSGSSLALVGFALVGGLSFLAIYRGLGGMPAREKEQMLAGIPAGLSWIRSLL